MHYRDLSFDVGGNVDDPCGLQSKVSFAAVSDTNDFIQLRAFGGVTTYSGTFTIGAVPPPAILDTRVNPANGHAHHLRDIAPWNVSENHAVTLGGHLATVNDQAEHDWIVAQWHHWGGVDIDLWCSFNDAAVCRAMH